MAPAGYHPFNSVYQAHQPGTKPATKAVPGLTMATRLLPAFSFFQTQIHWHCQWQPDSEVHRGTGRNFKFKLNTGSTSIY